jgi:hypothetical protein
MFRKSVVPPSSGSVRTWNVSSSVTVKSCHSTIYFANGRNDPGWLSRCREAPAWTTEESGFDSRHSRSFSFPQRPKRGFSPPILIPNGYLGHYPRWQRCRGVKLTSDVQCRGYDYVYMATSLIKHKDNFTFLIEITKHEQYDRNCSTAKEPYSAVPQHNYRLTIYCCLSSNVSGVASQFLLITPTSGYDKVDRQLKNMNHSRDVTLEWITVCYIYVLLLYP